MNNFQNEKKNKKKCNYKYTEDTENALIKDEEEDLPININSYEFNPIIRIEKENDETYLKHKQKRNETNEMSYSQKEINQHDIINPSDADDLSSEKILITNKKSNFRPSTSFFSKMDNIAHNKLIYSSRKTQNEFIKKAIENLKVDDEMMVLNALCELRSDLSLASDSVADDVNCQNLIKELIGLFDKYNSLPDISLSAITCLNYIIDLNPRYATTIIKFHGVERIVKMTQDIEYIDCAESAIKSIEKMSLENPYALLENDSFQAVLMLIDFFDLNLRKSALKACVNMSKALNNTNHIVKFILPAIPSLTNLTKYSGNSELEKLNLDLAIQCFYNIAYHIKLSGSKNELCNSIIQYGLLDNTAELFISFLDHSSNSKQSSNILPETFKNILRLFEILSSLSSDITDVLLNMNILEILYSILSKELVNNQHNKKLSSSSSSCYTELFTLLISFFPNKKSKTQDRILSQKNSHFFIYFSDKILTLLIDNVLNIPSSNTMVSLIQLLSMYIHNSQNDYIEKYINSDKLSNIAGKMLDSKDSAYINEVFNIVEVIMNKIPEVFFVSFIREGVVDLIKDLEDVKENQLYIPIDNSILDLTCEDQFDSEEMEVSLEKQILEKDTEILNDSNILSVNNSVGTNSKMIFESKDEIQNEKKLNSNTKKYSVNNSNIYFKKTSAFARSSTLTKSIQLKAKEISERYFREDCIDKLIKKTNLSVNPKEILMKLKNFANILKNFSQVTLEDLVSLFEILFDKNKVTFYEIESSEIVNHLANFIDENFTLNYDKSQETETKTTVNIFGKYCPKITLKLKMLFIAMDNNVKKITEFINILQYCISSMNCFKLFLYDIGNIKNASHLFLSNNRNQIPKFRLKFQYIPSDYTMKQVINEENSILKETYDYFVTKKNISLLFEQSDDFNKIKEELMKFRNKVREEITNSNNSIKDEYYEDIFSQLRNRKGSEEDIQFTERLLQRLIERKKSIESYENSTESPNKNYQIDTKELSDVFEKLDLIFYIEINNTRMDINNEWTLSEFFREMKSFYKRNDFLNFTMDMQINFDLKYKSSSEDINLENKHESCYITLPSFSNLKAENYEQYLFEKYYHNNIINNKSLYCIKRASPFIFLISLLELSVNNFQYLFEINNTIPINSLENLKMSSLLFKQVKDPYAISSNNIPKWCKEICQSFTFMSNFNSRYLLFKISTFDSKKSMTNLYIYLKNHMGENILEDKTLNQQKRQKVKVDRSNIIKDAMNIMIDYKGFNGYLEFEYYEETGTGIGPTYEFYSIVSKEIRNVPELWYKTTDLSLFPSPVNSHSNRKLYETLGFVIARALYDDRLIEIPLSSLFWDLVLDRSISFSKITKIDKDLGKAIHDFLKIIKIKQNCIKEDISQIKYNNSLIEDIGLTFNLPGFNNIELKVGGSQELVTIYNLEEYLSSIFEKFFFSELQGHIEAFKFGFNSVFSITALKCFTSLELEEIIFGCPNDNWDYDILFENITPLHGFDKNSIVYKNLIKIMIEFDSLDKKKFLLFVTGSPRLPLGGFKNLNPKMTVVKKQPEVGCDNPDDFLPTVMTCQNYLKIPEYSSYEILKSKLIIAINEGGNAFHLS